MLTIYGVYRSRASRNYWMAGELGIAFQSVPVMQASRLTNPMSPDAPLNTMSPEFLAVNPMGMIPSIKDGDLVMHESLAINLYLARKYGGPLAGKTAEEEGLLAMWTMWAATEVEPHSLSIAQNGPSPEAIAALRAPFAVLNDALADGYLVGKRFTVADVNVAEVVRYAQAAKELFDANPKVKAWFAACLARPAYRKMWDAREKEPA